MACRQAGGGDATVANNRFYPFLVAQGGSILPVPPLGKELSMRLTSWPAHLEPHAACPLWPPL